MHGTKDYIVIRKMTTDRARVGRNLFIGFLLHFLHCCLFRLTGETNEVFLTEQATKLLAYISDGAFAQPR